MKKTLATALVTTFAVVGLGFTQAQAIGDDAVNTEDCVTVDQPLVTDWTENPVAPEGFVLDQTREKTPATDGWTETIEDEPAGWQRYSYNGPWESNTDAPPFPSDNWTANTENDSHNVGVEGAYFRSNGNSGKGDWFYLELVPAVTHTVEHPGTPAVLEYVYVKHNYTQVCTEDPKDPPVDECLNGGCVHEDPEPPVIETSCDSKKCVKTETYPDGHVTETVKRYENVVEEGF